MINKDYSILWGVQFISQVGNRLYLMALAWYFVANLNNNSGLFLLFIISSLPSLLLGLFAGPLVERWNKKKIIIWCDIFSGILTGLLAFLVYFDDANSILIYIICFLLNTLNLFFSPSVNSMLPTILKSDQLHKGMSYMKMITFLGQILGAAIGGVLVGFFGVWITILINSISFFISAFGELFIKYSEEIKTTIHNYKKDMISGINYVRKDPLIKRVLTISIGTNLFIPVIIVFLPIIIKEEMGLDALHYGFADAMMPIGAVLMAVLLSRVQKRIEPLKVLAIGILCCALCYLSISTFQNYVLILAVMLIYGACTNYINIQIVTYFLLNVEPSFRGRFFSILESFSYASISLSYVLATMGTSLWSPKATLGINGCGLCAFVILALFWNKKIKLTNTK